MKTGFEDFALVNHVVEHLVRRVGAVEELAVQGVEGFGLCLNEDVDVGAEVVLGRDAAILGNGDTVGHDGIDGVSEGTEGVAVGGEVGDTLKSCID